MNNPEKRYDNILLDESELKRAKQFKFDLHRERFIQSHLAVRAILKRYTDKNPAITQTDSGKPYLKDYPSLQFNLSHSGDYAVCAITQNAPLGIDIECCSDPLSPARNFLSIAKRFFAPDEYKKILEAKNRESYFLTLWTRKEAYLKLLGKGLSHGLRFEIPDNIQIHDFQEDNRYTGALAVEKKFCKSIIHFEI